MMKTDDRIASIDILRALTVMLMIFVNNASSLSNIPSWIGHVKIGVSGVGLADIVFPAFLFIVGLSIPFAINNRRNKGDSDWKILKHILFRTLALLVMGIFLVNGETYNADATGMARYLWNPLCCVSFVLIWNDYSKANIKLSYVLRGVGIIALLILAYLYRGSHKGEITHFAKQWWGILGIIGWCYLTSAVVVLCSKNRFWPIFTGWAFFCLLSIAFKAHLIPHFKILSYVPNSIMKGTLPALVLSGALSAFIFIYYRAKKDNLSLTTIFLTSSAVLMIVAVYTNQFWGLSKLGETPPWLFLCSAITLFVFTLIYWISDVWGKAHWFNIVKPAGTDTLLCYLSPYLLGFLMKRVLHIQFPAIMQSGNLGLLRAIIFAFLCVGLTFLLNKLYVRLKL